MEELLNFDFGKLIIKYIPIQNIVEQYLQHEISIPIAKEFLFLKSGQVLYDLL